MQNLAHGEPFSFLFLIRAKQIAVYSLEMTLLPLQKHLWMEWGCSEGG